MVQAAVVKKETFFYPVNPKTMHEYASRVFGPIRLGQCITLQFHLSAGQRKHTRFLIDHIGLFKKEVPDYNRFLLCFIDEIEMTEESPAAYLRLLYSQIKKRGARLPAHYGELFKAIKTRVRAILKEKKEIVFFLHGFDQLPFMDRALASNLKAIWAIDKNRVHFGFLVSQGFPREEDLERLGELNQALIQNIVSIALLEEEDVDYCLNRHAYELQYSFSPGERQAIKAVAGGHPYIVKAACRLLATNKPKKPKEFLESQYQIKYLKGSVLHKKAGLKVSPDGQILLDGQPVRPIFSAREYELLQVLVENPNRIVARDQIAEIMWGEKESYEKYSDWAMNQAVATLRQKLVSLGLGPGLIKTVKKKGYSFLG